MSPPGCSRRTARRKGEVAHRVAPGVELDRAKALVEAIPHELEVGGNVGEQRRARIGGDAVPGAAEQPVERQIRPPGREVEERDLDGRQRATRQREHPRSHVVHDRLPIERTPADQDGDQVAHRLRGVAIEVEGGGVPYRADALDALVVADAHHDEGHELLRQVVRPGGALRRRSHAGHPDMLDPAHGNDSFRFGLGNIARRSARNQPGRLGKERYRMHEAGT